MNVGNDPIKEKVLRNSKIFTQKCSVTIVQLLSEKKFPFFAAELARILSYGAKIKAII